MTQVFSISFVMPAYNCADTVVESVESIIDGNFEEGDGLIIVNDCSTDETAQVLSSLKRKYPFIQLIHNAHNMGCSASRNVGINRASNPIIFNLDSDNILVPNSIKQLKGFMISEKADVAAFGELHFFRQNKNKVSHKWIFCPGILTLADFLSGHINAGPAGNFMYTKESWQRVGKYWEYGPGLHEAWGFSLKQIAMGSKFVVMPNTYYLHRYGYDSVTIREWKNKSDLSLMATKMILPFLDLIEDSDAAYIKTKEGSETWFDNLGQRPIRLKTGEMGRTGRVVYLQRNKNPLTKAIGRLQSILRAGIAYCHQDRLTSWIIPSRMGAAVDLLYSRLLGRPSRLLPAIPDGLRLHVGAGQHILDGYENIDGFDNMQRPDFFQTPVTKFARAESLDEFYQAESVAEIRCHHMFEHISILDVDRTLQGWNRILKPGGLVWIEVPDFEGCARQILKLKHEEEKEIFYRHIFGSQVGPGEFHYNGLTATRLIKLLENYGFKVKVAYIKRTRRVPRKPDMYYPSDVPLPDLTVKAIKISPPKPEVLRAEWSHIAYRRQYPNPALTSSSQSPDETNS